MPENGVSVNSLLQKLRLVTESMQNLRVPTRKQEFVGCTYRFVHIELIEILGNVPNL